MGRIILANIVLIGLSVWIHYESLRLMSDWFQRQKLHRRFHLLVAVFGAITAHFIEIALYGLGFYLLLSQPDMGRLTGVTDSSLLDCIYFSVSNFSSLGMGDIQPLGLIRFVAGFEALATGCFAVCVDVGSVPELRLRHTKFVSSGSDIGVRCCPEPQLALNFLSFPA